jgi:phosphoglycerate dehydrogenase-like enzyme
MQNFTVFRKTFSRPRRHRQTKEGNLHKTTKPNAKITEIQRLREICPYSLGVIILMLESVTEEVIGLLTAPFRPAIQVNEHHSGGMFARSASGARAQCNYNLFTDLL